MDKQNKAFERMDRISAITNKIANINEVATNPIDKVLKTNEGITKLANVGDHIMDIMKIIVPIITAILGYVFGRFHELFIEKRSVLTNQFKNLYLPFEKIYLKETHGAFNYLDLDKSLRDKFFNTLINNHEYADPVLKNLIMEFKWCIDSNDIESINLKFQEISRHISDYYNKLSKKLYYPILKIPKY